MSEAWPLTKIGDSCDILDSLRVPLNAEEREEMQGDIPYYGANGLQGYIDKFIFDEPLILLAEDGGYFDEHETRPIAYRIYGKSWVNNHAHILRVKAGCPFCQDFIFYSLQHKNITPFIKGGTRAKLNQSELREILIPTPPEKTQRRIAEILSTLDEAIEQTEELIAKMQQVKAGLMHDLFTRGVTPDGRLRPTREQAPELYKESPLGWIPREWDYGTLQDVVSPNRPIVYGILMPGTGFPGGVPVIKVKDVVDGEILTDNLLLTSPKIDAEYQRSKLRPDDVLLTIRGTVGRLAMVPDALDGANITQDTARVGIVRGQPLFYRYYLETAIPRAHFVINTLGVAVQGINLRDVRTTPVPMPGDDEQKLIAERLDSIVDWLRTNSAQVQKLRQEKHGLMHDLLIGCVRVTSSPNRS